jgi:hypothetical protein
MHWKYLGTRICICKIEGQRQRAQHPTMASTSSSCVDNVSKALMTWLKIIQPTTQS